MWLLCGKSIGVLYKCYFHLVSKKNVTICEHTYMIANCWEIWLSLKIVHQFTCLGLGHVANLCPIPLPPIFVIPHVPCSKVTWFVLQTKEGLKKIGCYWFDWSQISLVINIHILFFPHKILWSLLDMCSQVSFQLLRYYREEGHRSCAKHEAIEPRLGIWPIL